MFIVNRSNKIVNIDYLYLDLKTCDRCIGTDVVLEEAIEQLKPALKLAGYHVVYNKIEIQTEEDAIQYKFMSSPTIRVNGFDICKDVIENNCGCCSDISGTQVDCRVFEYEGVFYEVPPIEMLAQFILKHAFDKAKEQCCDTYEVPENLKKFFKGKNKKCCKGSCC